ncbi:MAG: co-chaperone GroES [Calditrichaeota bacterium]|nr:co-chaperone GroES [Calditrichota bacterium]
MAIQPIDERVLIKPLEQEERKVGSIIIPDTAKERPQMGEVIAVGDDVTHEKETRKKLSELVKVGDRVIYAKYGGTEVKIDGVEHLIVSRNDILAVVR